MRAQGLSPGQALSTNSAVTTGFWCSEPTGECQQDYSKQVITTHQSLDVGIIHPRGHSGELPLPLSPSHHTAATVPADLGAASWRWDCESPQRVSEMEVFMSVSRSYPSSSTTSATPAAPGPHQTPTRKSFCVFRQVCLPLLSQRGFLGFSTRSHIKHSHSLSWVPCFQQGTLCRKWSEIEIYSSWGQLPLWAERRCLHDILDRVAGVLKMHFLKGKSHDISIHFWSSGSADTYN